MGVSLSGEKSLWYAPQKTRGIHIEYSPYTYTWENVGGELGGNARHLEDIPVRAYKEPDVKWSLEHRRKSYHSKNAIDMAALINDL